MVRGLVAVPKILNSAKMNNCHPQNTEGSGLTCAPKTKHAEGAPRSDAPLRPHPTRSDQSRPFDLNEPLYLDYERRKTETSRTRFMVTLHQHYLTLLVVLTWATRVQQLRT